MRNPTEKQLALAQRLGIDVAPGTTRAAMGELIDHALTRDRVERAGAHSLPNDVSRSIQGGLSQEARAGITLAIRESGVRVGSIVESKDAAPKLYVVTKLEIDRCVVIDLETGYRRTRTPCASEHGRIVTFFRLRYNPPKGCVHMLVARPAVGDEAAARYVQRRAAFREYVASQIKPEEQFRNEYGIFWFEFAVNALWEPFDVPVTPAPAKESAARFCVVCGKPVSRWLPRHCSRECRGKPTPKERHCWKCGVQFTADGSRGNAANICPEHRG